MQFPLFVRSGHLLLDYLVAAQNEYVHYTWVFIFCSNMTDFEVCFFLGHHFLKHEPPVSGGIPRRNRVKKNINYLFKRIFSNLELMTKYFFSVIISFTESSTNNISTKQIAVPNC